MSGNRIINQEKLDAFAAKHVYWWGHEWIGVDLDSVLVFILAKRSPDIEDLVRAEFGITDEDFRRALQKAAAGVFIFESHWEKVNKRFGFDPPLPFPKVNWGSFKTEQPEEEGKSKPSDG